MLQVQKMKTYRTIALILSVLLLAAQGVAAQTLALRGKTIHTMAGAPIEDGVVLIDRNRIQRVGTAGQVAIPEGCRVLEAEVVIPGLIDAHATIGLTGYLNQAQDQDVLERSSPIQPELRALDAYNPRERLVEWARSFGVTDGAYRPRAGRGDQRPNHDHQTHGQYGRRCVDKTHGDDRLHVG